MTGSGLQRQLERLDSLTLYVDSEKAADAAALRLAIAHGGSVNAEVYTHAQSFHSFCLLEVS